MKISRRQALKTGMAALAATAVPENALSVEHPDIQQTNADNDGLQCLEDDVITHGGVQDVMHPQLGVEVKGQTCIRYLRFNKTAIVDHLEIGKLVYGRWVPGVPVHPAHLIISSLDRDTLRWKTIREINLPADERIMGKGLSQDMRIDEMNAYFEPILKEPPLKIPMGGLKTDHLRIICDREHQVWPNHGECNGGSFNVPFGILNNLKGFGKYASENPVNVQYRPLLRQKKIHPEAPDGMQILDLPDMLLYKSKYFTIGFSLHRPVIMHLGWDIMGRDAEHNRLFASRRPQKDKKMGGVSGPMLRTLRADYPAHLWTGEVVVDGNRISYQNLQVIDDLTIDAVFTVKKEGLTIELTQTCKESIPVIEAESWRFAWDITKGITGIAGMPTLKSGRNGDIILPAMWASDGNGCLSCRHTDGNQDEIRFQAESYRFEDSVTSGFVFGKHAGADECQVIPAGKKHAVFEIEIDNFEPKARDASTLPSDGLKKHWGTVFSCFRPEHRGFSNHAASVNCHLSQGPPLEIIAHTKRPAHGPDPLDLAKFTIGRALLDGGGYGYWRNLYQDSDPVLISAAGRIYQANPEISWLKQIESGLVSTVRRMLNHIGENGMVVCKDLSGNSGSYRWSTNGMDVIGFGHIDGYVNAWTYRAFRNAAAMLDDLSKNPDLVLECRKAAKNIQANYAKMLINPETGWVAGWRSRDEQLHDYAFLWVNGVALSFGLVEGKQAKRALEALEVLRERFGPPTARIGLPCNLLPIREEDHMLPKILNDRLPTFETYTDGSISGWPATYYIRALAVHGLHDQAKKLAKELTEGYGAGIFNGGVGSGHEFRSWEGLPTGYEGTLIGCFGPMYGIAIEEGIFEPYAPEWWPENG